MSNYEPESPLIPCLDCQASISRYALTCPRCGRPLKHEPVEVIPGARWSWTIYWGIVLFAVIPTLISAVITVLGFLVIAGMIGAAGAQR